MTTCCECGASVAPDENFCGSCGARRPNDDTPLVSRSGSAGRGSAGSRSAGSGSAGSGSVGSESSADNAAAIVSHYSNKLAEDGSTWIEDQPKTAPPPADSNRHTGEIAESAEFSS